MNTMAKVAIFLGVVLVGLAGALGYLVLTKEKPAPPVPVPVVEPEPEPPFMSSSTIGSSVEGRDIVAYTFGEGDTHLLFVGGIHGGYEWNTALLAYEMIDHLEADPEVVGENLAVTIIPDLNPDGTFLATGVNGRFAATDVIDPTTRATEGRFNANNIDLNRNFACRWEPESTWRGVVRSAGTEPFSEPEAATLRDWVTANKPDAAVFWHSIGNAVFTSECDKGVLPGTTALMNAYAPAANYEAAGLWTAYTVTGDAEGWLASIGIPAITVELEAFNSIEWERNLAGTLAVLESYQNLAR